MAQSNFSKATWLLHTVYNAKSITLEELQRRWELSRFFDGQPLHRSTVWRYRNTILESYQIEMVVNNGAYSIKDADDLRSDHIMNWLFNTLSYAVALADCKAIYNRILLETQADDHEVFLHITNAMRYNQQLHFSYRHLHNGKVSDVTVEPYCIKYFEQRWYLLAKRADNRFFTYAMERITDIEILPQTFEIPPTFDAKDYYRHSYGIMAGNDLPPAEQIILRVYGKDVQRMKEIPWHLSQKIMNEKQDEDCAIVSLFVHPTNDLIGRILSRAYNIEVLEPEHLRQAVQEMLQTTLSRYL